MPTPDVVIESSAIVFVAAALQRAVGFGLALIAVPLLAFVVPTKEAVVLVVLVGAVTSVWVAARLRHAVAPRPATLLGTGSVLGAPLGVVVLSVVSAATLRLALGVVTCAAAFWVIVSSRLGAGAATVRAGAPRTISVGFVSGVLSTSLATNGPPLVYELRRTGFRDDRFRGTISAVFVVSNMVGLPLLAATGHVTSSDLVLAAATLLPCVAGIGTGADRKSVV